MPDLILCLPGGAQRCLLCGQCPPRLSGTLLLELKCPKVMSPWCDRLRDRGWELPGSESWAALMQILLVVKQDERDRSVERESAPDRIYLFFLPAPWETFESLRAAFHIVAQVELH